MLIVQGLGYPSDASWRLLPGLSLRHTVIQFDNRGVGRSDVGDRDFEIGDLAADAIAVIEATGLGPVHVVGFSMGGLVAQEVALTRPELVCTLTLACTSPGGPDAVPPTPRVAALLAELATLPARDAAERAARIVYAAGTPVSDIVDDTNIRMANPTSRAGYLAQLRAVNRYPGTLSRLHVISVPVLIVHGDADRLVPPANAELLAGAIRGSRMHLIAGAGHILTTDATAELIETILDHVAHAPATP